jgi:hypothetical protein
MCESKQPEITGLFSNEKPVQKITLPLQPPIEEIVPQESKLQPMLTGLLEQLIRASTPPSLVIPEKDDVYSRKDD